ncbi:MAG TPA: ABC transporter permease [Stellaceae bacterium]|nr:ABC transporter permease [Stellaceae bacterium]
MSGILSGALVAIALALWLWLAGLLPGIWQQAPLVEHLLWPHLYLVAVSGGIAIVAGVAAGIVLSRPRFRDHAEAAMQAINIGNTVPTLAVLALAMSVLGIGSTAAIVALAVHSVLPIARNTFAGITAVPAATIEAAAGMGMTEGQILRRVEIPNALPAILAGVRTAMVINAGTAPLAFLIGGGGLGELIFAGIDLFDPAMMLAGAIPSSLLAIALGSLAGWLAKRMTPRGIAFARA